MGECKNCGHEIKKRYIHRRGETLWGWVHKLGGAFSYCSYEGCSCDKAAYVARLSEYYQRQNSKLERAKAEVMNKLGNKLAETNVAVLEDELKNLEDWRKKKKKLWRRKK